MNAYDVLKQHHVVLKGLGKRVSAAAIDSDERHALFAEMLIELDIHFRIEDDIYYPALSAASGLLAVAHAQHRQVNDQLSVLLRTPQSATGYEDEWNSFKTVLEAHADEEERDMIPAPPEVELTDEQLDNLGIKMAQQIEEYRNSETYQERLKRRVRSIKEL